MAKPRTKFTFDKQALEQAVVGMVDDKLTQVSRKLNALTADYEGRPVDEVKDAVARVWAQEMDGTLPDDHLTAYAEQIAAGGTVRVVRA